MPKPENWSDHVVSICPADGWYAVFDCSGKLTASRLLVWAACKGSENYSLVGFDRDTNPEPVTDDNDFVAYVHFDEIKTWRHGDGRAIEDFLRNP